MSAAIEKYETRIFPVGLVALSVLVFGLIGCQELETVPVTESMHFVGQSEAISAAALDRGREAYIVYCYGCHGMLGDGNGPASYGLRPPPRDLRTGTYKFGKVLKGLPHDDDFDRIVRHGLDGSAMLAWDIPDSSLNEIIQYIKTFAPDKWRVEGKSDEDVEKLGTKIHVVTPWESDWKTMQESTDKAWKTGTGNDCPSPYRCLVTFEQEKDEKEAASTDAGDDKSEKAPRWVDKNWAELLPTFEEWPCVMVRDPYVPQPGSGKDAALLRAEAIELGKKTFHAFQCWQCHPAYATTEEIGAYTQELNPSKPGDPPPSYRDHLFSPQIKPSDVFTRRPWRAGVACDAAVRADCPEELGDACRTCQPEELCVGGFCEFKVAVTPPDFLLRTVRSGSTIAELFKTIAIGVQGTAMVGNLDAYKDHPERLWALAYYVRSLLDARNTPMAAAIRNRLNESMPPAKVEAPAEPAAPKVEEPAAPKAEAPAVPKVEAPAEPAAPKVEEPAAPKAEAPTTP